jgi:ParB family chromosome partitioning protein
MAKSQTKAKTTKPPVAAKAATTAITKMQDFRMIPVDQLELSPLNVRKVAASATDDAELLTSIRENGIKQNLVVHAVADGKFAVDAGGRRLKALKQLGVESGSVLNPTLRNI